jgi:two-component system phosphate regulon sensor histidine kinase PhoR
MIRKNVGASAWFPALFLALTGIPLAALGWLGWRLLAQDLALESERKKDRLENAAALLAHDLDRTLATRERQLTLIAGGDDQDLPASVGVLLFNARGVTGRRGLMLPYVPQVQLPADLPTHLFAGAEQREIREQRPLAAAPIYRGLASASDKRVRAAALVRLARCLRADRPREALAVYDELAELGDTVVFGEPSELVARRERIVLRQGIGDAKGAAADAASLAAALTAGHFLIDRATLEQVAADLPQRLDIDTEDAPDESWAIARAAEDLWSRWREQPTGRAAWRAGDLTYYSVWRSTPSGSAALIEPLSNLMVGVAPLAADLGIRVALTDDVGAWLWGDRLEATVMKDTRATGLPWSLAVAPVDPDQTEALFQSRRNVMMGVFGLMAIVMTAATGLVWRAVRREIDVAQRQSDFLAAVSHEFRTPLSAMSHLTEVLSEGRGTPARLPEYYDALGKETRRLHGLVESLLDFGRTESGRRVFDRTPADLGQLVSDVVAGFRVTAGVSVERVQLDLPSSACWASIDRDALALVVRNLLDNAVKYSPDTTTVHVRLSHAGSLARIVVEDAGAGIPKGEQRDIFRKFVRGTAAKHRQVKGTGIGLTMALHVVRGHGGRLTLDSEPDRGSRFSVILPTVDPPADAEASEA